MFCETDLCRSGIAKIGHLNEQGSLLVRQRIVKTTIAKQLVGSGDRHEFHDTEAAGSLHTEAYELLPNASTLAFGCYGQALQLGHLFRVNFNRRKSNHGVAALGDEGLLSQLLDFLHGSWQQPLGCDVRLEQCQHLGCIVNARFAYGNF